MTFTFSNGKQNRLDDRCCKFTFPEGIALHEWHASLFNDVNNELINIINIYLI